MIAVLNTTLIDEHQAEIRRQVAANRLARSLRQDGGGRASLLSGLLGCFRGSAEASQENRPAPASNV